MALAFNGTTQYLRIANNTLFNFTPSVTLMGWAMNSGSNLLTAQQRIASRYLSGATGNEQYGIDLSNGVPRFLVGTTTTVTQLMAPSAVTTMTWNHICGTYDGTTMLIYVNGALVNSATRSGTITSSTGVFSIGADYNGTTASEYFTGSLEDIRLYNRALTAGEIRTVVTCRGTGVIRNGLILNLQLDEQRSGATLAASATVYDTGPNKLNATNIIASATFVDGFLRRRRFS
jgi:hypothetical protein